jgi:cytidyltransferase-like protein
MSKKYDILVLSGGFDPPHIGHARMIKEASEIADNVIVGVNSDDWLEDKKGYIFMPWTERSELVSYFKGVTETVSFDDSDGTACDLIEKVKNQFPDKSIAFGNGGDRVNDNVPEVLVSTQLGVELVWKLGGGKIQSSSDLVKNANQSSG